MSKKQNWANKTIWTGDCLYIMRGMNSESVDLIYLDPPFNSNANYAAPIGSKAAGAEFKDTWSLSEVDVEWINLIENKHPVLYRVLLAAMTKSDKSYLVYMAARILEMKRLLKPTGSIYLHCDPTMSHYLKLVMDAVFGRKYFRNEIVWFYRRWAAQSKRFQRMHDIIFFYSRTENHVFNKLYVDSSSTRSAMKRGYNTNTFMSKGVRKKQIIVENKTVFDASVKRGEVDLEIFDRVVYREHKGVPAFDVFEIPILNPQSKERTGYPTQKPLKLLSQIIRASSNEGDVVLDPFCGCATTCVAADYLQRNWVGIDISSKASELVVSRIKDAQGIFRDITHRTDIPKRTDLGNLPAYNSPANRKILYGEQDGNCAGCGTHFESRNLEVDHIISLKKGGTDHLENLQLLCGSCNRIKGDRGMDYLKTRLQMLV